MSLEDSTRAVNAATVELLMIATDQTAGIENLLDLIAEKPSSDPELTKDFELVKSHMRFLLRTAVKLSEENAELYDRYIKFLNSINSL